MDQSSPAIVHEWFETLAGSERVVGRLLGLYLQARLMALVDFLPEADLIVSSSHCVAKGVRTRPDQLHLSYVHAPMRHA